MNRFAVSAGLGAVVLILGVFLYRGFVRGTGEETALASPQEPPVKTAVIPEGSTPPIGPYTPAVRIGNMLFLSGQIGIDPATGQIVEGGTVPQARQAMTNLRSLLSAAGMTFDDVVRATVYLADIDDYGAFNEEYARNFGDIPPARVCIEVARIPRDARVEISMIAVGAGN